MMKTTLAKDPGPDKRSWYVMDAAGQPLGRLAVRVTNLLRGRTRPDFTPHVDTGGFVVILNAEKVRLTGRKDAQKLYTSYSGYRGGLKTLTAAQVREKKPDRLIKDAVWGMLPENRLSRQMFRRLKVYAGTEHPHAAQNPVQVN